MPIAAASATAAPVTNNESPATCNNASFNSSLPSYLPFHVSPGRAGPAGPLLYRAAPPPEEEPIAKPEEPSGTVQTDSPGLLGMSAPGQPPLAYLTVDFSSLARGFNYKDPLSPNLRPYNASFLPTIERSSSVFLAA